MARVIKKLQKHSTLLLVLLGFMSMPFCKSLAYAIADKYEYDAAIVYVGELVAEEVSCLAEASSLGPTVASACKDTYRKISQEASQRLEARAEHSPELARNRKLQELLAHRVVLLSEQAALKSLTVEGAINQQLAEKLQLQLEG